MLFVEKQKILAGNKTEMLFRGAFSQNTALCHGTRHLTANKVYPTFTPADYELCKKNLQDHNIHKKHYILQIETA